MDRMSPVRDAQLMGKCVEAYVDGLCDRFDRIIGTPGLKPPTFKYSIQETKKGNADALQLRVTLTFVHGIDDSFTVTLSPKAAILLLLRRIDDGVAQVVARQATALKAAQALWREKLEQEQDDDPWTSRGRS